MSDHQSASGESAKPAAAGPSGPPIPGKPRSGAVKTSLLPTAKAAFLEDPAPAAPPLPKPQRPADRTGTSKTSMIQAPSAAEMGLAPAAPAASAAPPLPRPQRPVDRTGTSKTGMIQAPSAEEMGLASTKAGPPPIPVKKPVAAPGVAKTVVRANARADFLLDDFAGDIDIPDEAAAEIGVKPKDAPKK